MLKKTLESPLDGKETQTVNSKGNQPWIFTERTDAEVEAPIFWPLDVNSWHIRKGLDAEKDWSQEEKETTEVEIVGWHHWYSGYELEQTVEDGEGQRSLESCSLWGHKELDTIERLNNNNIKSVYIGIQ